MQSGEIQYGIQQQKAENSALEITGLCIWGYFHVSYSVWI